MNQSIEQPVRPPTAGELYQIDAVCDRFEAAWRAGKAPEIDVYVDEAATEIRSFLQHELFELSRALHAEQSQKNRAQPLEPGATLGDYRILEVIASGGMGVVYKAMHQTMQREVALKVPLASANDRVLLTRRFMRELRVAGQFLHPQIVTAFDAGDIDGQPYLAMEYVSGKNLRQIVDQQGPLSVEQVLDVAQQAASALGFIHEAGVVHRDVKPSNLLLSQNGVLKLLDLGLARGIMPAVDKSDSSHPMANELTGTGVILGTIDYMSPEQARGSSQVDARADIYSLGCTLYFLLAGRSPFPVGSAAERLSAHLERTAIAVHQVRADVPEMLGAAISRMMAKEPEKRFASMQEFLHVLCALETQVDTARPMQAASVLLPSTMTWRIIGVFLLLTATIGAAIWYSVPPPVVLPEQVTADSDTRRVAIAALRLGGHLQLHDGREITSTEEIPSGSLQLQWIDMQPRDNPPLVDSELAFLEGLEDVQQLHLGNTKVTDAGLVWIRNIRQLEHLYLTGTPVTEKGLATLAPLTNLKQIVLMHCPEITDSALPHLQAFKNLRYLNLYGTGVTDKGMSHVAALPDLVALDISHTAVGDQGLAFLADLNHLEQFSANSTRLTPASISVIATSFPQLKQLSLTGLTTPGEFDLTPLKSLRDLEELHVENTSVMEDGIKQLQEELPHCKIHPGYE